MDRRAFIGALAGGLLAAPLAAEAQPAGRVARIGATVGTDTFYEAFLQGLVEAGWVPGQNAVIERRSVRGEGERVPAMVAELVGLQVGQDPRPDDSAVAATARGSRDRVGPVAVWLVTCSCGWGREASSEWAANAVSRLHRQLADIGTEHVTKVAGPGQQLSLDKHRDDNA